MNGIKIVVGDITTLKVDAIVTLPTNRRTYCALLPPAPTCYLNKYSV